MADVIGAMGAALLVIAYLLLQLGRLDSRSLAYSLLNAVGAALIVVSLYYNFNLAAFIIELFWVLISLLGIYRAIVSQANAR
ncbi:MAG TPA: hypothetical protein VJ023_03455 [Pyrinomonadaceae bacterium]|jgi:hypothetical protein|nr:hypothetical protein [Pyrinomonadaceae bacterium]